MILKMTTQLFRGGHRQKNFFALTTFFTLIFISCLFLSCGNLFGNGVSEYPLILHPDSKTVDFKCNISVSGAYPWELAEALQEVQCESRSAIPSLPASITIKAKASATGYSDIETTLTAGATSFTLSGLTTDPTNPVTWTITVTMYDGTTPILSDSCSKELTAADPVIIHDFILKPESSSGTGSVSLEMTIPDTVSSISLSCPSSSWTINSATVSDTSATISASSLAAGAYEVSMIFKNASGYILYTDVQTINVFSGMTTDTWVNGVATGPVSGGAYTLTEALIADAARTMLYVGTTSYGDASDTTGNGSVFAPFETIAKACSFITATGDASKNYTIFLTGTLTGAQTIEGLTAEVEGVTVKKANSLTIIGQTGLDGTGRPRDSLDGEHVTPIVLTVDTIVPVTLKEILISSATDKGIFSKQDLTLVNCEISNNAQGLHSWNKLTVKNCKITQNTNKGIYIAPTEVLIQDSEISYNSTSGEGGGICIEDIGDEEVSVEINGCTISYNGASYAGGIYDFNSPVKIHDTIIENNTADGTNMNGGGIYLNERPSEGIVELSGTTIIRNNSCTGGGRGGAIYSLEIPVCIKDSVYIPAGAGNANDVYLCSDTTITISGSLDLPEAAGGIAATITPSNYNVGTQLIEAGAGVTLADEVSKFVVTQPLDGTELFYITNAGRLATFTPVFSFDNGEEDGSQTNPDDEIVYDAVKYSYCSYDNLKVSVANPYEAGGFTIAFLVDGTSGDLTDRTVADGYHTLKIRVSKTGYTPVDISRRVYVKIKPVKVQISTDMHIYGDTGGWEYNPCIRNTLYIDVDNPDDLYEGEKTCLVEDNSGTGSAVGDSGMNYYRPTIAGSNYVWLTAKSSTFYFYGDACYDYCIPMNLGVCEKGNENATRTLEALKSNTDFNTGYLYMPGNTNNFCLYTFSVSLDDTTSP